MKTTPGTPMASAKIGLATLTWSTVPSGITTGGAAAGFETGGGGARSLAGSPGAAPTVALRIAGTSPRFGSGAEHDGGGPGRGDLRVAYAQRNLMFWVQKAVSMSFWFMHTL